MFTSIREWWRSRDTNSILVNVLAALVVFAVSSDINNLNISIAMILGGLYIVYDCVKKRSLNGFFIPKENLLGMAVFLGAVLFSSLLTGDLKNIHVAGSYIYWTLPFFIITYLGNQADIRYAAVVGGFLTVFITGLFSLIQQYIYLHKDVYVHIRQYLKQTKSGFLVVLFSYLVLHMQGIFESQGRIGAFDINPNFYGTLLIGILPLLLVALKSDVLRQNKWFVAIDIITLLLGCRALWMTGSRGAVAAMFAGGLYILLVYTVVNKKLKTLVTGLILGSVLFGLALNYGVSGRSYLKEDEARKCLLQSSYHMWLDHKITGVGLANWAPVYATSYAVKPELNFLISSHNAVAWFFSATGIIGGCGYIFFLFYYAVLLTRKIKQQPDQWVLYAGLWAFIAINLHGMVDMGIVLKQGARLLYLTLGLALTCHYDGPAGKLQPDRNSQKARILTDYQSI